LETTLFSKNFLFATVLFVVAGSLFGQAQTNCSKEKLMGKWKEVASVPGQIHNLDSLKNSALSRKRQISTWEFKSDLRYRHRHALQRSRYKRNGIYLFDNTTCEIILGKNKDAREQSNLEIIFIDSHHLIYQSNNNPKGYFTHLLSRIED
jgi:hypothetical protein